MAADVQSIQETRSEAPSKHDLVSKLDDLLEQYLHTLDAYQKAHQQLTAHLSSGYLYLAQANFNNAHGRFGRDYYDERMQASRTVALSEHESKVVFAIPTASETQTADAGAESPDNRSTAEEVAAESQTTTSEPEVEKITSTPSERKMLADPIRWFGILVPPALRSAQASFVSAVVGPISQLSTLAMDLRKQEVDIGRLRKQIKKLEIP
ncbi:hypothetical protein K458DRAFT_445794 [Lentithecium fluviatile CBS 122367]|uniref:Vacuolar ATPase assembly protein VMA22 n=1 Tax=Lentithecium fluviatile CBS 122367 TaxID=1168545 RepID=A0A6G1IMS2_9PLEO|nr:hypothetical protein K458DRAFT_445794 [Lentithecium fluviatile CBS 122367]